jgi:ABC-type nitrate/sulfonate/bicarbonate transport system substrate-binding protein
MYDLTRRQAMRRGLGLAAAGITIPVIAACGDDDDDSATAGNGGAQEVTDITLQLGWLHGVEWAGSYVAADKGYHRDHGLNVSFSPGGPQTNAESRLAAGRADMGIVYGVGVALANKEGADIRILGAHLQKSPSGFVSLAENPVNSPEEMVGKRIGVPTNSVAAMDAFLEAVGVDKEQVEYVPVQDDLSPLTNGDVDAFYTYFTETGPLEQKGIETKFIFRSDFTDDDMSDMYGATQRQIDENRDMIVEFLRAEIKGYQDFIDDPQLGIDLAVNEYGKALGLTEEEQRFQAERYVQLLQDHPIVEQKGLFFMNDRVKRGIVSAAAAVDAPIEPETVFDESLLEEAYGGKTRL